MSARPSILCRPRKAPSKVNVESAEQQFCRDTALLNGKRLRLLKAEDQLRRHVYLDPKIKHDLFVHRKEEVSEQESARRQQKREETSYEQSVLETLGRQEAEVADFRRRSETSRRQSAREAMEINLHLVEHRKAQLAANRRREHEQDRANVAVQEAIATSKRLLF